jgi:hypothetical protein
MTFGPPILVDVAFIMPCAVGLEGVGGLFSVEIGRGMRRTEIEKVRPPPDLADSIWAYL